MEKFFMDQSVAVMILFFNKIEQTKDCINSFLPSGQKIYVLNNGSDISQWKKLQAAYSKKSSVVLFDAGKNLGPSGGRNFLISHTQEPWMIFVDSDITIQSPETWLSVLTEFLNKNPLARIICPRIFNIHEQSYMEKLRIIKTEDQLQIQVGNNECTNFFPEGGVIIHRSIFENYGLYDEELFAFEGYEFSLRALMSPHGELKVFNINDIELIHDHKFQKGSSNKKAVKERYNQERMKKSYDYLVTKHNIKFEHNWQWWTKKQEMDMTKLKWKQKIKQVVKFLIGK